MFEPFRAIGRHNRGRRDKIMHDASLMILLTEIQRQVATRHDKWRHDIGVSCRLIGARKPVFGRPKRPLNRPRAHAGNAAVS
jgi:hypothetical protein